MKEQLQKLKEARVGESKPDDEPTTWISPLIIQPKKAVGKIWLCVDMRKPNEGMLRKKREFPTVENILQELNGAVKFSKLDLNHQPRSQGLSSNLPLRRARRDPGLVWSRARRTIANCRNVGGLGRVSNID